MSSPNAKESLMNFLTQARKTSNCVNCKEILNDPVKAICGHYFCSSCFGTFMDASSPPPLKKCPQCSSAVCRETNTDRDRMKSITECLSRFVAEFCRDADLPIETVLDNARPETGLLPNSNNTLQVGTKTSGGESTPAPQQKVDQWLGKAGPSRSHTSDGGKSTPLGSRNRPSRLSTGRLSRLSRSSSTIDCPAAYEIQPSLSPPSSPGQEGTRRGRGARRGRQPAKKNILPLRSVEKVPTTSRTSISPKPKQLFQDQTSEADQTPNGNAALKAIAGNATPPAPMLEQSKAAGVLPEHTPKGQSSWEREASKGSETRSQSVTPTGVVAASVGSEYRCTNAATKTTPSSLPSQPSAEDSLAKSRLTFSLPTETQDLASLSVTDSTQDLFSSIQPTPTDSLPSHTHGKPTATTPRLVTFHAMGRIAPRRSSDFVKKPIPFRLLGKLVTRSQTALAPIRRCADCMQNWDSPANGEPIPTRTVQLVDAEAQTVSRPPLPPVLANAEVQTSPFALASVEVQTDDVSVSSATSVNTSSSQSFQPMPPVVTHDTGDESMCGRVITVDSEDSNSRDVFAAQSSKRPRQLSSSSDTEESQEAKRICGSRVNSHSDSARTFGTSTPVRSTAAESIELLIPQLPISTVQPSTPTTKVLESDPESEDLLVATPKTQREPERRRLPSVQKKIFICSGLTRLQIKKVEELGQQLGAQVLPAFVPQVTHVIVRVDEDNLAERTLKFLYGVAGRKWVISIDWVHQCLKEQRFVGEDVYEVLDMDGENGPCRARLSQTKLFSGFEFCCVEPFDDVTVDQLRDLLQLCGAESVLAPSSLRKNQDCSMIILQADGGFDARRADQWCDLYKVPIVSREWILDCVASYQLFPIRAHLIGRRSEFLLKKMRFDEKLIR